MLREEGGGGVEEESRVIWVESNRIGNVLLLAFHGVCTNLPQ